MLKSPLTSNLYGNQQPLIHKRRRSSSSSPTMRKKKERKEVKEPKKTARCVLYRERSRPATSLGFLSAAAAASSLCFYFYFYTTIFVCSIHVFSSCRPFLSSSSPLIVSWDPAGASNDCFKKKGALGIVVVTVVVISVRGNFLDTTIGWRH